MKADPDAQGAEHDFWSLSGIFGNHVFRRTSLYVPKDDFPIPVRYVDVCRQTRTSLDVLLEHGIDDQWHIDADRSLADSWIGAA